MSRSMARAIATVGYAGRLPVAPGTVASLLALPLAYALHRIGSFPLLSLATALTAGIGFWASARAIEGRAFKNAEEIVIDKIAGQLLALWPLSGGLWWMGAASHVFPWPGWVGAFVLFRFLDIAKPGPVGWANRRRGAAGIMLDDFLAGLIAAILIAASAALAHGWLM